MCNAMYEIVKEGLQDEFEAVRINAEKKGEAIGKADGIKIGKADGIKIGKADGIKSGEKRVNTLIYKLISLDRMDDVVKCVSNKEYQDRLFQEFQL